MQPWRYEGSCGTGDVTRLLTTHVARSARDKGDGRGCHREERKVTPCQKQLDCVEDLFFFFSVRSFVLDYGHSGLFWSEERGNMNAMESAFHNFGIAYLTLCAFLGKQREQ